MWQLKVIHLVVTLASVIIQSASSHELSFACEIDEDQRGTDEYFVYVSCVLGCTNELHFEELRELNKTIKVKFNGDESYPEILPNGLSSEIVGVGNFYYHNTPLKRIQRSDFKDLKESLSLINLADNQLEDIQHDCFHDLPNLSYLSLENNKIKKLAVDLFKFAPQLTTFVMRNNQINELHPALFERSPFFYVIYADYNRINQLSGELFASNQHMEVIAMRHNAVENVGIDFRQFKNLSSVDLRENLGACDLMFTVRHEHKENDKEAAKIEKDLDIFQKKVEDNCRK